MPCESLSYIIYSRKDDINLLKECIHEIIDEEIYNEYFISPQSN
jgi:hypothetical protein